MGWLTVHDIGKFFLRITQWWVVDELQRTGIALLMLHRVLEVALRPDTSYLKGSFGLDVLNSTAMRQLCERKIESYSCGVTNLQRAYIKL